MAAKIGFAGKIPFKKTPIKNDVKYERKTIRPARANKVSRSQARRAERSETSSDRSLSRSQVRLLRTTRRPRSRRRAQYPVITPDKLRKRKKLKSSRSTSVTKHGKRLRSPSTSSQSSVDSKPARKYRLVKKTVTTGTSAMSPQRAQGRSARKFEAIRRPLTASERKGQIKQKTHPVKAKCVARYSHTAPKRIRRIRESISIPPSKHENYKRPPRDYIPVISRRELKLMAKRDAVGGRTIKKDAVKKDPRKDRVGRIKREMVAKRDLKKEAFKKDALRKDAHKRDLPRKDAYKRDLPRKDCKKDHSRKDLHKRDVPKRDPTPKREGPKKKRSASNTAVGRLKAKPPPNPPVEPEKPIGKVQVSKDKWVLTLDFSKMAVRQVKVYIADKKVEVRGLYRTYKRVWKNITENYTIPDQYPCVVHNTKNGVWTVVARDCKGKCAWHRPEWPFPNGFKWPWEGRPNWPFDNNNTVEDKPA